MPEVAPFPAIRFDHARTGGDLSNFLAPPYDVLDQADKDALIAKSDRNIVAIDLPHLPPKSMGPPEEYQRSARLLTDWLADGTLVRESQPALYLYHQRFEIAGSPHTRRMFIARVRLHQFSDGVILPHEETFGGPKEDRLALMKATKCNLSPVFALYTDSEDRIGLAFAGTADGAPDATALLDGVENRLWIVTDGGMIDRVVSTMVEKQLYIADGHHRYGTALNYRDWFIAQHGGSIPQDHPVNFIMLVMASMDDPGCLILPYYRTLAGVEMATVVEAWSPGTQPASPDQADIVLFDGRTGNETALRYTAREKLATLEPAQSEAWRRLDAAYLHRYLIDELLQAKLGSEPIVGYVKSTDDAKHAARTQSGVALLVNATPMADLRAVSEAGGLMPQKSTYFHPKLATGLAINPLT